MRVLGISDHFVSGAAVIEDGRVVSAVNEERLARMKMVMGWPRKSIVDAMKIAGVEPKDLDYVAIASAWGHFLNEYVPFDKGVFGVDEGIVKNLFFSLGSNLSSFRTKIPILEKLYYQLRQPAFKHRREMIQKSIKEEFGITCPVKFLSHHYCHAAAAYYASGYDDALIVTLDGAGDGHSSHVYDVAGGKWEHLHSVPSFDSLGDYYAYVTHICGFTAGKHEGKITGLAAYGEPAYRDVFNEFIRYENGSMRNVGNAFRHAAVKKLRAALPADFSKADLAATVQQVAEDVAGDFAGYWQKRRGRRNIALAGGVFANVKINQRIHELPGVDSVFVYPAMSDEGIAAGAALIQYHAKKPADAPVPDKCFDHVYLGWGYSDREIQDALDDAGIEYGSPQNLEADIADLIQEGFVVARFDGRMEYGPRALGNRSILYRPDDPTVNDWLNERLKRTEFMPFAPATIAEDVHEYYLGAEGALDTARFMTITFNCTQKMKDTCAGVVHVDGTARPQLVNESDNPKYYRIIQEYKRLTGNSSIVNTSFNIHEEPIVCTPQDAIRAFKTGHLDVLAIGPFLVKNPDANPRMRAVPASSKEKGAAS
jgi:carbamoyltransferase